MRLIMSFIALVVISYPLLLGKQFGHRKGYLCKNAVQADTTRSNDIAAD